MSEQEVFVLADRALLSVVKQIKDDQWNMSLPDWFLRGKSQADDSLRTIINYHAYDEAWIPDMLAGKTMSEVGNDKYKGDLLKDDPIAVFSGLVDKAIKAVESLDDPERTVHCSFGDFKAREYLWQANSFRGFRSHDIAKLIGVEYTMPEDLVKGLWGELSPHFEEWRAMGVFPAAIKVGPEADLTTKLLAASGRQP